MNGDDDFFVGAQASTPEPLFQSTTPSVFGDFLGAAQEKFGQITERFRTAPTSPESSVGGSIFNALYSFGAGKVDLARSQLVSGFLATGSGRKIAAEARQQELSKMMPLIIGGVVVLLIAGFAFGRR